MCIQSSGRFPPLVPGARIWFYFPVRRDEPGNSGGIGESMPSDFESMEEALCRGLVYACREDLAALSLDAVLCHGDIRRVEGSFLTTQGSVITRALLTVELTGCRGGTVRICVTRYRFGYGLWLVDREGKARQA